MKKLVYGKYDIFMSLEENYVNELIIENPPILAEMVQELTAQADGGEGGFVLSEDGKPLPVEKKSCVYKRSFFRGCEPEKTVVKIV